MPYQARNQTGIDFSNPGPLIRIHAGAGLLKVRQRRASFPGAALSPGLEAQLVLGLGLHRVGALVAVAILTTCAPGTTHGLGVLNGR